MSSHPLNLLLRFLLEISALAAFTCWGWLSGAGVARWILALGLPLLAAVLWGTFAVPHDPSRSGRAPVPVSGAVRLALELGFFLLAGVALAHAGHRCTAGLYVALVLLHHLASLDRLRWLLQR